MSCYLIKVENGHKVARSITSEEEYKQLRGSNEQKANLRLARAGNDRKRSISSCVEAMSRRRIFIWLVQETMLRKEDWCSLIIPAIIRKGW